MASQLTPREAKRQAVAKQKAARAAEKARKKASNDPRDMGRVKQVIQAYKLTHEYDKPLPWLLLGAFVLPIVVGVVVGLFIDHAIYLGIIGIMVGLMLAMLLLANRAKRAAYRRYAGQAGSAEVALNMLPKQWTSTPAITATKQLDTVHRAVGPGGIVLIGEGEPSRVRKLLAAEASKHQKVNDRATVTTLMMGNGKGQVPLEKLTSRIRKLPKTMQAHEITEVKARLTALDAVRPRMPMPKGPMPTSARQMRGSRQALRGR